MTRAAHESVLDHLGTRIACGELASGATFTLADLEHDYRASRTVIREAVRVLESLGMIGSRRRVGLTVRPIEEWSALDPTVIHWRLSGAGRSQQLVELTEFRIAVEPIACRLAAARASHTQRAAITALAERLRVLGESGHGDSAEYLEADIAFHALILDASGNLMLAAVKEAVGAILSGRVELGLTPARPHDEALGNHILAAQAIADGDADLAEQAARRYVETILSEVATGE